MITSNINHLIYALAYHCDTVVFVVPNTTSTPIGMRGGGEPQSGVVIYV